MPTAIMYGFAALVMCGVLATAAPSFAENATELSVERLAGLSTAQQVERLHELLATDAGRSLVAAQLEDIAERLPSACEALIAREQMPIALVSSLWQGIQEDRVTVPAPLELAIVLHHPKLTLADTLRSLDRDSLDRMLTLAGGYRGIGDELWADKLKALYTTLEACSQEITSPTFLSQCSSESLLKLSPAISAQAVRIQISITEQKLSEAPQNALNVIERLLRLPVEQLHNLQANELLRPSLRVLRESPFPADRARVLNNQFLRTLKQLLSVDEELAEEVALLCVTGARDAIRRANTAFALQLLEESFAFYPQGLPEQAVLAAELGAHESVVRDEKRMARLNALPLPPVRSADQAEASKVGEYLRLLTPSVIGGVLLCVGIGLLLARRSAEYRKVKRADAARRNKDATSAEDTSG